MFISQLSWGQESQRDTVLNGNWEYYTHSSEPADCEAPSPFPIKELHFQGDQFTLVGLEEKVTGDYEYADNVLRMYNAVKNGKPQAKDNSLTIKSINKEEMVFEFLMDCGTQYITLKKIS